MTDLTPILIRFPFPGTLVRALRYGSGLINDTYCCEYSDEGKSRRYILQRINTAVFREPEKVMENIAAVTAHIARKAGCGGEPATVALVPPRDGRPYFIDGEGAYWRVLPFIEGGRVFDTVGSVEQAYEVGRAIGRFQALLADLPPDSLHVTLPGFHITPQYLAAFRAVLAEDPLQRASGVRREIEQVLGRERLASLLTGPREQGAVPLRIVHNDPKVNNVLMNSSTGRAICMLDLDTVQAGLMHFDFGDCVRSVANPAGEDAADLAAVTFDLSLFEAVSRGYLREAKAFLTEEEVSLLAVSAKVITYELGMRFLADHLAGDRYFRTSYPGHNLHRARVQLRLLECMEAAEERMRSCISGLARCG